MLGVEDRPIQLQRTVPLAGEDEDRRETHEADLRSRVHTARLTELEARLIRIPGRSVVAGVFEHVGNALIRVGCRLGEIGTEGELERGPCARQPVVGMSELRSHRALNAEYARPQVEASRSSGGLLGLVEQLSADVRCPAESSCPAAASSSSAASAGRPPVANEAAAWRRATSARSGEPWRS